MPFLFNISNNIIIVLAGRGYSCWPPFSYLFPAVVQKGIVLSDQSSAAVVEPVEHTEQKGQQQEENRTKRQPRYHVVLWDDDEHTYDYVIRMMKELFGHSDEKAFQIAKEVDTVGRVICLTTTKEHAELKRDQIHAYGADSLIAKCKGAMTASIEPEC